MTAKLRSKAFHMTLTPTIQSTTHSQYEKMMSDFSTQLRTFVKLDPSKKWKVTLTNAFIPIDTRFFNHHGKYQQQWFQYIWRESHRDDVFEEKHYFLNNNVWDDISEFVKEFNRNRIIGHNISLCKIDIPIELGLSANEFLYIRFKEDIVTGSTVGFRLPAGMGYRFIGTTEIDKDVFKGTIFKGYLKDSPAVDIPYKITVNNDDDTMDILFSPIHATAIRKDTIATSAFKCIRHKEEDGSRIIDIECSIVESNKIAGIPGKTLRCVVDNVSDGTTEIPESKQDMYLPVELHEFSYISCRLLHHSTLTPIEYKYESVVGRPYIVLKIAPE